MRKNIPTNEVLYASNDEVRLRQDLHFRDYRLENAYLRVTECQRAEILAVWREEVPSMELSTAERRIRETVYLVRAASGELAGVSEAALVRLKGRRRFYAYTMLLRASDRVPYLMLAVLNATRDFLRHFPHPLSQPEGMVLVTENPKLMRPGVQKLLARHGYQYWGRTAWEQDVWAVQFGEEDNFIASCPWRMEAEFRAQEAAGFQLASCASEPLDSVHRT